MRGCSFLLSWFPACQQPPPRRGSAPGCDSHRALTPLEQTQPSGLRCSESSGSICSGQPGRVETNAFLEALGLAWPGVEPPCAGVAPWDSTWGSSGAGPTALPTSRRPWSTQGRTAGTGRAPCPGGAAGAELAARLFCARCDVAPVTLASFPLHGFSKSPAAPPPPRLSQRSPGPRGTRCPRGRVT